MVRTKRRAISRNKSAMQHINVLKASFPDWKPDQFVFIPQTNGKCGPMCGIRVEKILFVKK